MQASSLAQHLERKNARIGSEMDFFRERAFCPLRIGDLSGFFT